MHHLANRLVESAKALVRCYAPQRLLSAYSYIAWRVLGWPRWRRMGPAAVFTHYYRTNAWHDPESRSGFGSTEPFTRAIRTALPDIIARYGIESMLDVPCGDFHWMRNIDFNIDCIGADIVDDMIARNRKLYETGTRTFVRLDLLADALPKVDLVFCRDCLFHFSLAHVAQALQNIKRSGSTYLLVTTNVTTIRNSDIVTGQWRPVNLQIPPFQLPEPLELVDERNPGTDKHMGLWRLSNL